MEIYHVLNRGVDKRKIFLSEKDYVRFVHNLFAFNDYKNVNNNLNATKRASGGEIGIESKRRKRELLVKIHAFVLMPNHYHLLITPLFDGALPIFLKKINMGYSKYFNEKNNRTGALFQGKTKRILIDKNPYYMHIVHYIHCNPLDLDKKFSVWRKRGMDNLEAAQVYLEKYRWSSYRDYIEIKNFPSVTNREEFKNYFDESNGGYINASRAFLKDRVMDKQVFDYLEK